MQCNADVSYSKSIRKQLMRSKGYISGCRKRGVEFEGGSRHN